MEGRLVVEVDDVGFLEEINDDQVERKERRREEKGVEEVTSEDPEGIAET